MWKFWMALVAATLLSSGAIAQERARGLHIPMGTQTMIRLTERGTVTVDNNEAEPLTATELQSIEAMLRDHPDAFGPKSAPMYAAPGRPPLPAPQPDRIRFRFVPFEKGSQSLLIVENGTRQSYMYKARIGRGDRSMVTDVCQLIPEKRNVEHWPYPIDWIEVSDFRAISYEEGRPPLCA